MTKTTKKSFPSFSGITRTSGVERTIGEGCLKYKSPKLLVIVKPWRLFVRDCSDIFQFVSLFERVFLLQNVPCAPTKEKTAKIFWIELLTKSEGGSVYFSQLVIYSLLIY